MALRECSECHEMIPLNLHVCSFCGHAQLSTHTPAPIPRIAYLGLVIFLISLALWVVWVNTRTSNPVLEQDNKSTSQGH